MIPFDRNTSPLSELRPDALLENRNKNTMLKHVQFTSGNAVSVRVPITKHSFQSLSSRSKNGVICPICKQSRTNFFCSGCIRNGDFTHSTHNVLERFAEKKLKFIDLKGQQSKMENELKERQANIVEKENLLLNIRQVKNNIALLKRFRKLKSQRIEETNNSLDEAKRKVLQKHDKQIKLKKGIAEVKNIIARQNVTISERSQESLIIENELQSTIRARVLALTTFIFEIGQKENPFKSESKLPLQINSSTKETGIGSVVNISSDFVDKVDEDEDTPLLLLSETSSGSFSTAIVKCVSDSPCSKNTKEVVYYRIGEPWLASNEDFKVFFQQSPRLENLDHSADDNFRCSQYRMLSALSYLCHVTNLIAIFSNLILPKRVVFSDFYGKNIHRDELYSLVAKVCTNIIYLALFYHVDSESIKPRDMFHNLILILYSKSKISILNRKIEISASFSEQLKSSLLEDLSLIKRDFLAFHEAQDEPEYDFVENNIPDLNFTSPGSDQGTAGNLISMISSFYKRATQ